MQSDNANYSLLDAKGYSHIRSRRTVCAVACIFIVILATSWCSNRLQFTVWGGDYNAGVVEPGRQIRHDVFLANISPYPISVVAVPSCGCTIVDQKPHVVAPLRILKVKVVLHPLAANHMTMQEKSVAFYCDAGAQSWIQ